MPKDLRGRWVFVPAYLAAHLALDWISFIHEVAPLNITPWNPPAGLMMGMLIVVGFRAVPLAWLGLMVADLMVRDLPVALWVTAVANGILAAGYGGAAWVLRRRLGLDPRLAKLRDIVLLLVGAAMTPLAVGAGYIALHTLIGLFPWSDFAGALLRYWVGEVIGIAVLTPVVLVALRGTVPRASWRGAAEMAAYGLLIGVTLWLDFGPLASAQYEHFYLLFLPAVAVAVRHGLAGAALASAVTQGGLIVAIQVTGVETARTTHFQLLMLTLAVTALLLGAVVSERRRVEAVIRERQSDLDRASRLTEAGEMAAALAHELNQPLSAAMSYARAARKIAKLEQASPRLNEILDKTVVQAERADRVIRSLRDFVRKGRSDPAPLSVGALIADCLALAAPVAGQHSVSIQAEVAPGLPAVSGDAVQLQQVILNLVRNAAEAMDSPDPRLRRIVVFAHPATEAGFVTVGVRDSGPGLSDVVERNLFAPFVTTKATGMGLGLSIAHSIVEGHGGTLTSERLPHGETVFRFTLPIHGSGTDFDDA
ncbi:His Kinase A (phospho-acceptor) domain-containing protein [Azospirillum oryzae]|uniref:histidine kinase n=1 Tax=Azospirillum oryzae TaxID=286727 RepID=A0A1X7DTI4_9PROT|nr:MULTISPECIES: MASE1 domain-containing protein [Azospirillum]PWC56450.1 histidine kinase [Azospirillum sp. TSH7]PWC65323.1 histidine kinase [Azospirillum sp. TSH20]SMF21184.1 His Kinase A (phospho-acceptor) domain-containing protein [Azospirillum oryzae]